MPAYRRARASLHLSAARSVELVRRAKADGLAVTAEAAPHHFSLTDEPLRRVRPGVQGEPAAADEGRRRRARGGLADGTIDAIATDHAPHPADQKERPLDEAPPGMVGLETALGVCLPILTAPGMPLVDVVGVALVAPGRDRRAGRSRAADRGRRTGQPRGVRPDATWDVVPAQLASRSHNTPYVGRALRGQRAAHDPVRLADCRRRGGLQMNGHTIKRMNMHRPEGVLVLADGSVFEGELIGAQAMGRGGSPSPNDGPQVEH